MENFDVSRLDGHSLRVFLSLCETCSVSRTADLFELNQSTVSYTLDKLRAAIGDPLFVRSGRGITPTEKALAIVPRVQEIVASLEGLVTSEVYDPARETRPYVIAISSPALLQDMKVLHREVTLAAPAARFDLRRLAPREILPGILESGEADLAVAVGGLSYPVTLNHAIYGTDDLVVYFDSNHRDAPETPKEYASARHAVAGFGGKNPSLVEEGLLKLGLDRTVALNAPTASMLGDLVRGTDLVATMPRALAGNVYRELSHCPAPVPLPKVEYHLVWHRRHEHSGRNEWFRNLAMQSRREIMARQD